MLPTDRAFPVPSKRNYARSSSYRPLSLGAFILWAVEEQNGILAPGVVDEYERIYRLPKAKKSRGIIKREIFEKIELMIKSKKLIFLEGGDGGLYPIPKELDQTE